MSSLLDKLAMGLSEWPSHLIYSEDTRALNALDADAQWDFGPVGDDNRAIKRNANGDVYLCITESQWLQRRKELINEPDDADAPEWAKWVAQDSGGDWWWYEGRPVECEKGFILAGSNAAWAPIGKIPAGHDWRETLRKVARSKTEQAFAPAFKGPIVSFSGYVKGSKAARTTALQEAIREAVDLIDVSQDDYVKGTLTAHLKWLLEHQKERIGGKG